LCWWRWDINISRPIVCSKLNNLLYIYTIKMVLSNMYLVHSKFSLSTFHSNFLSNFLPQSPPSPLFIQIFKQILNVKHTLHSLFVFLFSCYYYILHTHKFYSCINPPMWRKFRERGSMMYNYVPLGIVMIYNLVQLAPLISWNQL
jgi:predicted neutral ceramidase superfamily lipid hydrolase